jgi:hypothetical protein
MKEFIEKLISRLDKEKGNTSAYCMPDEKRLVRHWNNCIDNSIEIIKELTEEYNNGWIPCSERLPEEYGEYLCCDRYGEYIIGYPTARVSSDDYYVETEHEIMNDCIAWCELPTPYKEGE